MKRSTISQLTCGLAFAFLFTPNASAQSGQYSGGFVSPVQTGSFSPGAVGTSSQAARQSAQFNFKDSNLSVSQPIGSQSSVRLPGQPVKNVPSASGFNPTPFKVTGKNAAPLGRSVKTQQSQAQSQAQQSRQAKAAKTSFGSGTRTKTTQLPGHPTKPNPTKTQPSKTQLNKSGVTPSMNNQVKTPKPNQTNKSFSTTSSFSRNSSGAPTTAKPTSYGSPSNFTAQGRPSFGSSPARTPQITSSESSGGSLMPSSIDCPISSVHFIEDIQLPAREAGEIKTMNFKEGDFVPAGQTIAQINDENYQMMLEQAEMRYQIALDIAGDSTASLAAKKKYQVASIEAKKTERLAGSGSKSASDKMMANYTKEIAYLEMQKADRDRRKALAEAKLAHHEKKQVESKIARHAMKSDFPAYVIEINKHKQEYVQIGEEVMRLARMDRVWVQSVVNTKDLNAHELLNRKVTVTIQLARGETAEFEGIVKFVGLERQGPELLMVKAEVTNRPINGHWILHPEAEVAMEIHLNQDSTNSFGSASTPNFTR